MLPLEAVYKIPLPLTHAIILNLNVANFFLGNSISQFKTQTVLKFSK